MQRTQDALRRQLAAQREARPPLLVVLVVIVVVVLLLLLFLSLLVVHAGRPPEAARCPARGTAPSLHPLVFSRCGQLTALRRKREARNWKVNHSYNSNQSKP